MPEDGEYVVVASITNPWLERSTSPLRELLPSERMENTKKTQAMSYVGPMHGLEHYANPENLYYEFFFSSAPELILQCFKAGKHLNPLCVGRVWWGAENLGMYVRFSLKDLPRWRENIDAAYKLAHRWRENAKLPEISPL